MASPQTENGYTRIANELLEHLYHVDLTGAELRIMLCVIRMTYGWQEKETIIRQVDIASETGMVKSTINSAMRRLVGKNMLQINGVVGINKNWEEWDCKKVRQLVQSSLARTKKFAGSYSLPLYKENKRNICQSSLARTFPDGSVIDGEETNPPPNVPPPPSLKEGKKEFIGACIIMIETKRGFKGSVLKKDIAGIDKLWEMGVHDVESIGQCYDWLRRKWDTDNKMANIPISAPSLAKFYPEFDRAKNKSEEWKVR